MTDNTQPEALIDLIDAYAETRHRCGGVYNAKTEAARKAVIEALSGVQALSAAPRTPTVEQVEDEVSMGHGAWDMVDPQELIGAVLRLSVAASPPAEQQAAPKAAPGEPPGIQALMCVISSLHSLRDTAHFSDEEGELTNDLCTLRDWAYAQTADFQPSPKAAQAVVQDDLITLRKPTTSAELLWLLKLAHLVISDVGKTLEESVAPAQPAAEPSRFGSPELQAMIIARCVEKDQADNKKKDPTMSFHNKPNYQIPELIEALKAHRLPHDTPSQLADSFRIGWMACRELAQADSVPAVSDLPPLPAPDLRDAGTRPQEIKEFLKGYATEYARTAIAARATAGAGETPWRSAVLYLIDECPGLTMEQDRWLSRRVKELEFASAPRPMAHAEDSVQEDAARWNAWASGIVEACNSDEQEPAFLVALDKAIGDAEPPITLELLNEWTDAARKQGASHDR